MTTERGTPKTISRINRKLIISHLLQHGAASRADLVKSLEMSFPSLSANVRNLLNKKLILEQGVGNQNGPGRNSILLCANGKFCYVVGMHVEIGLIRVAVANFSGDIIHYEEFSYKLQNNMMNIINKIIFIVDLLDDVIPKFKEKFRFLAVGIHGIRNEAKSKNYLHLKEDKTDIEVELKQRLNIDVAVDNDVNMAVQGENWKHVGDNIRDIVFVHIGDGIGAGIMIDNELYHGCHNAAGEIGNMLLEKKQCAMDLKDEGAFESIILPLNAKGEAKLNDLILYISMVLENMICVLNPQLIILGGDIGINLMNYKERIMEILNRHLPTEVPLIVASQLGNKAEAYGAVRVALNTVRESIFNSL